MPSTLFFDVNETLSDLAPLDEVFESVGAPKELARTWYASSLRDGFALSLTTGAKPYATVARAVLTGLLISTAGLTVTVDDGVARVLDVFNSLPVHDDVVDGIALLAGAGHRLVALSNGSVEYTAELFQRAGIIHAFDLVLSVDDAGAWKPDKRAYEYAVTQADVAPGEAALVAVHPWDLHGAKHVGLRSVFIDRTATPWPETFQRPDVHVTALTEIDLP